MRHLISLFDLNREEILQILESARELKNKFQQGIREPVLPGRIIALLFAKPSLRTRVSFEAGMVHLGGTSVYLGQDVGWGKRESAEDFGRVLSQYVDTVVCRAHDHAAVEQLAKSSTVPVINGLTNESHPCQALTDVFTIEEVNGTLSDQRVTFVGDGNNVAKSLAIACAKLQIPFALAAPAKYQFPRNFTDRLQQQCPHAEVTQTTKISTALHDSTVVYTDVWSSMGQESEAAQRRVDLAPYQVNDQLMALAHANAMFMHCLPAHRGEEVTDVIIDGSQSVVVQQAGNRMHLQKGALAWLLGKRNW